MAGWRGGGYEGQGKREGGRLGAWLLSRLLQNVLSSTNERSKVPWRCTYRDATF